MPEPRRLIIHVCRPWEALEAQLDEDCEAEALEHFRELDAVHICVSCDDAGRIECPGADTGDHDDGEPCPYECVDGSIPCPGCEDPTDKDGCRPMEATVPIG